LEADVSKKKMIVVLLGVIAIMAVALMMSEKKASPPPPPAPSPNVVLVDASPEVDTLNAERGRSQVYVYNRTNVAVVVYFAFGADSVVLPANWPFCTSSARLTCQFTLPATGTQALPLGGKYLNTTFAFGAPVSCGSTKAELNVNNPRWYDVVDISLVDGYSNKIAITVNGTKLGPPNGASGNEKVLGVFPLGCDICTARQNPPCGMRPGTDGCKKGTQYKPDVPCQFQGSVMGGGSTINVSFLGQ
jgi:hypothetical protein